MSTWTVMAAREDTAVEGSFQWKSARRPDALGNFLAVFAAVAIAAADVAALLLLLLLLLLGTPVPPFATATMAAPPPPPPLSPLAAVTSWYGRA